MVKRIFGKKVKYKFCKLEPETMGEFDPTTLTIKISNNINETDKVGTEIHESFHAVCHILGFDEILEPGTEELLIANFEKFLMENYKIIPKPKKI